MAVVIVLLVSFASLGPLRAGVVPVPRCGIPLVLAINLVAMRIDARLQRISLGCAGSIRPLGLRRDYSMIAGRNEIPKASKEGPSIALKRAANLCVPRPHPHFLPDRQHW